VTIGALRSGAKIVDRYRYYNDVDNRLWIDQRVSGGQYTIGLIYGFGLSFRLALTDGHQEDVPLQPLAPCGDRGPSLIVTDRGKV
jgi:hypothetical protein